MNNNLFGKTLEELKIIVQQHNLPSFNAKQIADWLYKKQVESIDEMTNLSKIELLTRLAVFSPRSPTVATTRPS